MLTEMLELERQGWQSLCDGTGAAFYRQLMTRDGLMILAHGAALDRDAVAASLESAPPWRAYEILEPRLVALSDDHVILTYLGRAYRESEQPAFVARMSSVYTRVDGAWRLAHYQQTPVPAEG